MELGSWASAQPESGPTPIVRRERRTPTKGSRSPTSGNRAAPGEPDLRGCPTSRDSVLPSRCAGRPVVMGIAETASLTGSIGAP
jgi:hypothetical protein